MTWFIPSWLKRAVAGVVGAVALLWGAWVMGKREGTQAAKTDALQADARANEAGRDAAGKAKDDLRAGKLPEDIARSNDGRW